MTPSMTVNQRMAVSQRIVSQQTSAIALLPWLGGALSCLVRLLRPGCWSTAISYHFARASKGGLAPRGARTTSHPSGPDAAFKRPRIPTVSGRAQQTKNSLCSSTRLAN